ncbi:MAG TPA: metallophosphoesterase [Candidatus Moranbacteria bacterium]|nr:metallophosphoesterase [Candidatus Moranbacteria bacterium]HSA08406.1 metallophosphoesterase [Candidatus Moranbacteria bacterium]
MKILLEYFNKNRKYFKYSSLSIAAILLVVAVLFICFCFFDSNKNLAVLGVVSDIHAGNPSERVVEARILNYPKQYKKLFSEALDKMKNEGVEVVISAGDNTNEGDIQYSKTLKDLAKSRAIKILWTKGNHDREKTKSMESFGVKIPYYYIMDRKNWRIIILDNSEMNSESSNGGFSQEQLEWLKNKLKTDKKIIISMHYPIFNEFNNDEVLVEYKEFKDIIEKSGNVVHVVSGHYHTIDLEKNISGITYHIIKSLTLDKDNPNYKIISLE